VRTSGPIRPSAGALALGLAGALVALGVVMRAPVLFDYGGPWAPHQLNLVLMAHTGAYSDISHLYFRDRLWQHPAPYLDFRFEYPVLTGVFVWLASFVHTSVATYFLFSALLLLGLALLTVWALGRIEGANPWLFAAAPALALYTTLNWDLLGICLLVFALILFQRERDVPAAAVLALAVWAKVFPIVVLPVVLALRLADRRWRSALGIAGAFLAVTVAVNLPFALQGGAQGPLRPAWSYFFTFTQQRPARATIWQPVLGHRADLLSVPLFAAGLAAIVVLAVRARDRPRGSLLPASSAALLWLFATAKVYSPQYALWIFAALAIEDAPVGLAIGFALLDVLIFATTFGPLYPVGPLASEFPRAVQWGAYGLRQLITAAFVLWLVREKLGAPARAVEPSYSTAAR